MEFLILFISLIIGSELISIRKLGVLKCRKSNKNFDSSDDLLYYPTSCFFLTDSEQNQVLNSNNSQQISRASQQNNSEYVKPIESATSSGFYPNSGDDHQFTEVLFKTPQNNSQSNPVKVKIDQSKVNDKLFTNDNNSQTSSKYLSLQPTYLLNTSNDYFPVDSIQQMNKNVKASKSLPTNLTNTTEIVKINNSKPMTETNNNKNTKDLTLGLIQNFNTLNANQNSNLLKFPNLTNISNKLALTTKDFKTNTKKNASQLANFLSTNSNHLVSPTEMTNQTWTGTSTLEPDQSFKLLSIENYVTKAPIDAHKTNPLPENKLVINDKCNEEIVKNLNGVYYSQFGYLKFMVHQQMNYSMACQYCSTHCMKLASISTEMLKDYLLIKTHMLNQLSDDISLWVSNAQPKNGDCTNQNLSCPTVHLTGKPLFTDQFCNAENYFICQYQKVIPIIFSCHKTNSSTWRPFVVGLHKVSFGYIFISSDYVNHWEAESVCREKYCMDFYSVNTTDSKEIISLMKSHGDSEFWINGQSPCLVREDCICQYIITTNKTIQQSQTLCHTKRPFICEYRINN